MRNVPDLYKAPATPENWHQGERRAMAQMLCEAAAKIPCPRETSYLLDTDAVVALLGAVRSRYGMSLPNNRQPDVEYKLRMLGLVGYDGPHLTAYASAVRKELLKPDA